MNWLGAFLVVIASYLCGITLSKDEYDKLNTVESLMDLIAYMKRRMSLERLPLLRIFFEYDGRSKKIDRFLTELRSYNVRIDKAWKNAVLLLSVDENTKKELIRFGESLGLLALDEQIKRLDSISSFLEAKRKELTDSLPARQKSIKAVCTLIGLMTAIILL